MSPRLCSFCPPHLSFYLWCKLYTSWKKKRNKEFSPIWSFLEFIPGHRDLSIMWNSSRTNELHLPHVLGVQCEGKSCLLTSQRTPWEQRQSLMFPFITHYLLGSTELIKCTQSTCTEERIAWDQFLILMEQILFENLENFSVLGSLVFLRSSCNLSHTPFLLKPLLYLNLFYLVPVSF